MKFSNFAIRYANIVFCLVFLLSIAIVVYAINKLLNPHLLFFVSSSFYYLCIIFGILLSIIVLFSFKLNKNLRINISLILTSVIITMYAIEIVLKNFEKNNTRASIAYKKNIEFDKRSKLEVIEDFSKSGVKVYPTLYPFTLIESGGFDTEEGKLFPLGGISNVRSVYCNESGKWITYKSDEYGFNNPKKLYDKNNLDIVIIGDSFAKGTCVESEENIGSKLRESGFKTVSLSAEGNGPLSQLALLKEYGEYFKPKTVLWFFFPNDILDLKRELTSNQLNKYYEDENFSQNLIHKQELIDFHLKKFSDKSIKKAKKNKEKSFLNFTKRLVMNTWSLPSIRLQLGIKPTSESYDDYFITFKKILEKSNNRVKSWDGKLYFVYLPQFDRYQKKK